MFSFILPHHCSLCKNNAIPLNPGLADLHPTRLMPINLAHPNKNP